jgi:formate hydrogenlyase subunit 4
MRLAWLALHLTALLVLPILFVGLINRTKSLWSGRKGLPVLQALYDFLRLLRKRPVYSTVTTPIFGAAPYVVLGTSIVSGLVAPLLGAHAPLSFPYDFVFFAYAWGLGRLALMLGALDTGSSFEGMGASREATYSALVEPVLFLVAGTLGAATGRSSISELLQVRAVDPATLVIWVGCIVALLVVLQVESARIPVDDPNTHLELTMIHEVMILDHSGPDLAALQYGSAIKMTVCAALVATLLNPLPDDGAHRTWMIALVNVGLTLGIAVVVGTIESLIARLKLKAIPQYVLVGLLAAFVALLSSTWRSGGAG